MTRDEFLSRCQATLDFWSRRSREELFADGPRERFPGGDAGSRLDEALAWEQRYWERRELAS